MMQMSVKLLSSSVKTKIEILWLISVFKVHINIVCLHDQNKSGFFEGFYPANQSNLKSIQKFLIGWKKAGPPKKPLLIM